MWQSYPKYSFKYGVHDPHTGDIKQQWEERDGDKVCIIHCCIFMMKKVIIHLVCLWIEGMVLLSWSQYLGNPFFNSKLISNDFFYKNNPMSPVFSPYSFDLCLILKVSEIHIQMAIWNMGNNKSFFILYSSINNIIFICLKMYWKHWVTRIKKFISNLITFLQITIWVHNFKSIKVTCHK